jgi:hypothetical protein
LAWIPSFTHHVIWAAMADFMRDFNRDGIAAWEAFQASRQGRPYPIPEVGPLGEGIVRQQELEQRYFSGAMLEKYRTGA